MYSHPEHWGLWRLSQNGWVVFVSTAVDGSLIYRPVSYDGLMNHAPQPVSSLPVGGWEVAKFADQYIKDVRIKN